MYLCKRFFYAVFNSFQPTSIQRITIQCSTHITTVPSHDCCGNAIEKCKKNIYWPDFIVTKFRWRCAPEIVEHVSLNTVARELNYSTVSIELI
jgi:hypothetical protein